jgi:hypothetical protein
LEFCEKWNSCGVFRRLAEEALKRLLEIEETDLKPSFVDGMMTCGHRFEAEYLVFTSAEFTTRFLVLPQDLGVPSVVETNEDNGEETELFVVRDESKPRRLIFYSGRMNQMREDLMPSPIRPGQATDVLKFITNASVGARRPGMPKAGQRMQCPTLASLDVASSDLIAWRKEQEALKAMGAKGGANPEPPSTSSSSAGNGMLPSLLQDSMPEPPKKKARGGGSLAGGGVSGSSASSARARAALPAAVSVPTAPSPSSSTVVEAASLSVGRAAGSGISVASTLHGGPSSGSALGVAKASVSSSAGGAHVAASDG